MCLMKIAKEDLRGRGHSEKTERYNSRISTNPCVTFEEIQRAGTSGKSVVRGLAGDSQLSRPLPKWAAGARHRGQHTQILQNSHGLPPCLLLNDAFVWGAAYV